MSQALTQRILLNFASNSNGIAVKLFLNTAYNQLSFLDDATNIAFFESMCQESNVIAWMNIYRLFTGSATGKTTITELSRKCLEAMQTKKAGE
jgi:hypothetical protein